MEHILLDWTLWVVVPVTVQLAVLEFIERLVKMHRYGNHNIKMLQRVNIVQHLLISLHRDDVEIPVLVKMAVLLGIILEDGFQASELKCVVDFVVMMFEPPLIRENPTLQRELETAMLESVQYRADRVNYDMQLKSLQLDYKHEQEILAQHLKEKEQILRKQKHVENQMKTGIETMPLIMTEKDEINRQVILCENKKKKANACVGQLKKKFDLQMRNYLGIETVSKDVSARLCHDL